MRPSPDADPKGSEPCAAAEPWVAAGPRAAGERSEGPKSLGGPKRPQGGFLVAMKGI